MEGFLPIILVAVVLSMDAFGISIIYGSLGLSKLKVYIISIVVGIYHFFMPLIGFYFGSLILDKIPIKPNIIVGIIFIIISVQMVLETHSEKKINILNIFEILLFGLSVSIDSFTVGISLNILTSKYILAVSCFAITSAVFTYIGLKFGKSLNHKIGDYSTKIGALILVFLSIVYIID